MIENLIDYGESLESIPLIFQYNKRDMENIMPIEELQEDLNPENKYQYFETIAIEGVGVLNALKLITKLVISKI